MAIPSLNDAVLDGLTLAMALLHLAAAPHTKVEESFNMQAAHDMLVYGTPTGHGAGLQLRRTYDHFAFPGAVPRTFVGAVLLAGVGQPLVWALGFRHAQPLVRAVLAAANAASLMVFRRALRDAAGAPAATCWLLLLLGQFHVWYYLSRTLPNMLAFALTTLAFAGLLLSTTPLHARRPLTRPAHAVVLLVVAAAVFRAELALLLAPVALHLLLARTASLRHLVRIVALTAALALAISVPIDSYFWQTPLWPELSAFYFNAVLGSSSQWGTEPWHYYLTSALPRLLLNPLLVPLAAMALAHPATKRPATTLLAPSIIYLALYSLQPHKETRFVLYLVPPLTAVAALGAGLVVSRRAKSPLYALASLAIAASVLACLAASLAMLAVSSLNYPGGDALVQLGALLDDAPAPRSLSVHADVLTCMTGLTLFGQNPHGLPLALYPAQRASQPLPLLLFDKTEDAAQLARPEFWLRFDYALAEDPRAPLGAWDTVAVIAAFDGFELVRPRDPDPSHKHSHLVLGRGARVAALRRALRPWTGGWWLGPRMSPRIHILKRRHGHAIYQAS